MLNCAVQSKIPPFLCIHLAALRNRLDFAQVPSEHVLTPLLQAIAPYHANLHRGFMSMGLMGYAKLVLSGDSHLSRLVVYFTHRPLGQTPNSQTKQTNGDKQ